MTDPRQASRWPTSSSVVDDQDLLYQAVIGNLDTIYRHRLYAKARASDDHWRPYQDKNLGWVVQQPSTLHLAYAEEESDGIMRPLRCASEEDAEAVARRFNEAERRRRAGRVESAMRWGRERFGG